MTVAELIDTLAVYPPNANVRFDDGERCPIIVSTGAVSNSTGTTVLLEGTR